MSNSRSAIVRYLSGERLAEFDNFDNLNEIKSDVENLLPLGLSINQLMLDNVILPATAKWSELKLPSEIVVTTRRQKPEAYVTMFNGQKPFLVRILSRGSEHRVTVYPSWSSLGYVENWDVEDWYCEEEEEEVEEGVESKRRKVDSVEGDDENAESLPFGVTSHDFDLDRPLLDHFRVEDFFVGRSDLNEMTLRSYGFGPAFDGNAILLKVAKKGVEYIFVGKEMFSFTAKSEIVSFASPIGNSSVPYTYAVDASGRYYLFFQKVVLEEVPEDYDEQPHTYFYEEMKFNKCSFQLRYAGIEVREKKPFTQKQNPRCEKIVDGKSQIVSPEEFEKLLRKWFRAHGISTLQCTEIKSKKGLQV